MDRGSDTFPRERSLREKEESIVVIDVIQACNFMLDKLCISLCFKFLVFYLDMENREEEAKFESDEEKIFRRFQKRQRCRWTKNYPYYPPNISIIICILVIRNNICILVIKNNLTLKSVPTFTRLQSSNVEARLPQEKDVAWTANGAPAQRY
jgi:hypothetical protein